MKYALAFLAGFLATVIFHQGLLALLHLAGVSPRAAFPMAPTWPLGVPQWVSLAFWGGVWGIPLWLASGWWEGPWYWVGSILFGALLPSFIALFAVFPLKGQGVAGGWQPALIVGALLLNGAWGLGTALFLRLFGRLTAG